MRPSRHPGGTIGAMNAELLALDAPVCPACGYDLRGIDSGRCPECGTPVDRAAVSRIPWVHRRLVGRWRAYWRTWAMATVRTGSLAAEVRRPVSHRDGQTFRWATVALAWPPLAGAASWAAGRVPLGSVVTSVVTSHVGPAIATGSTPLDALPLGLTVPWLIGTDTFAIAPLAVGVLLVLLTGVGSYVFRPARLPTAWGNRAVALSYFSCAPLAFAFVPAVAGLLLAGEGLDATSAGRLWLLPNGLRLLAQITVLGLPAILLVGSFLAAVRLLRSATLAGVFNTITRAGLLAVLWAASAVVALVGLPWLVGYVRLLVESLAG